MSSSPHPVGVDFGGSGIKGATVDLERGDFATDRVRVETPQPSTPEAVAEVLAELVSTFDDDGGSPVGVTVPGVVRNGVVSTAANIHDSWLGVDAAALFSRAAGRPVVALNDADAAGLAESRYGAARGQRGLVIVTTLGTGIGSALLLDGVLLPNSELGHLEVDGHVGEKYAANSARETHDLAWDEWADRLTSYYRMVERLLTPDLFVVGGGVSKHADKFLPMIDISTPIIPALLRNKAGIIGAALHAASG
ncbi:polyphosphate--glucose phosphotransferase [Nocardioides rubriscoriae]|uniref:polyphosphate--glucose phosphotransferase n=1 Tax=Nocardioides rubriscoriae TaxID=642762 RepID=UPI0011E045D5|nr:ROK family protein [Nocardioides rubriscoriae]